MMPKDLLSDMRDGVPGILEASRMRQRITEPLGAVLDTELAWIGGGSGAAGFIVGRHRAGSFLTLEPCGRRCRLQGHPRGGSRRINTQVSSRASSTDV